MQSGDPMTGYIDAASVLVGLTLTDDWRPGVHRFLTAAAEMAAVLDAVPLDDAELAMAPVYRLPEPRGDAVTKEDMDE